MLCCDIPAVVPAATRESAPRGESESCSKCGTVRASGRLSCCARDGAWHQKCGAPGDKNADHTWIEGVQACNLFGDSMFFEAVEQVRQYRTSEQSINETELRGIPEQHTNARPTANASDPGIDASDPGVDTPDAGVDMPDAGVDAIDAGGTDGGERVGFAKFGVLANILFIILYLQM